MYNLVYAVAFNLRSALFVSEFYWCSTAHLGEAGIFVTKIPARLCQICVETHS
ncbi:MAG: hypothetical protein P1P64_02210 [Treponemataceae bacterium]